MDLKFNTVLRILCFDKHSESGRISKIISPNYFILGVGVYYDFSSRNNTLRVGMQNALRGAVQRQGGMSDGELSAPWKPKYAVVEAENRRLGDERQGATRSQPLKPPN